MPNIKLTVAYDGTRYLGWQKTKMGPSIEGELETVLSQIFQQPVALQGASRTDAGVHARGQIVNFIIDCDPLDLDQLHISFNQMLPDDIAVFSTTEAEPDFHASLNATSKIYRYNLYTGDIQLPTKRLYQWHYRYMLNLNAMKQAAEHCIGEKDFSVFCNVKKNDRKKDAIRSLLRIDITQDCHRYLFEIEGTRFLYKMARNIVGTLVSVGRGKIIPDEIPHLIKNRDRTQAGITAPAHGLELFKVLYA